MHTSTARTSITMNSTVLERLRVFAQRHNQTISQVIENVVVEVIDAPTQTQKGERYSALFKLKGVGKSDPKLKNMSVDEILYGDNGAWRGSEA